MVFTFVPSFIVSYSLTLLLQFNAFFTYNVFFYPNHIMCSARFAC